MTDLDNRRRGIAVWGVVVAGFSVVALSVCGIADHADRAAQRDIALVSAADSAGEVAFDSQVGEDPDLTFNDAVLQQNVYSWELEPISSGDLQLSDDSLLFASNIDDPQNDFFAGLFPQPSAADVIDQGPLWAEFDHLLGAGQALDFSADVELVAPLFIDDLISVGIGSDFLPDLDVSQLVDTDALAGADGIEGAVLELLQDEVMQTVWGDFFGVFSVADVTP